MNPTRFKIVGEDPPFYIGDFFWRLNGTEARRIKPNDSFDSENILCSIESTTTNQPLCINKNTVLNIQS